MTEPWLACPATDRLSQTECRAEMLNPTLNYAGTMPWSQQSSTNGIPDMHMVDNWGPYPLGCSYLVRASSGRNQMQHENSDSLNGDHATDFRYEPTYSVCQRVPTGAYAHCARRQLEDRELEEKRELQINPCACTGLARCRSPC